MKPSFFRLTSILATLACAAIGVVALAEPAAAAVTRHDGVTRFNWGRNCESVIYGYPYVEAAAGLVAGVLYDDAAPPKTGEVFYVVFEGAGIGDPYPCVGQKMKPDILLPAGVDLAVSAANPIRCVRWDYGEGDPVSTPETALCPTAPQPPELGGTASFGTADGSLWDIPMGLGWEVHVPVVASTPGYTSRGVRRADPGRRGQPGDQRDLGPRVRRRRLDPDHPRSSHADAAAHRGRERGCLGRPGGQAGQDPRHRARQDDGRPAGSTARLTVRARVSGKWVVVGKTEYEVAGAKATTVKVRVTKKWPEVIDGKRVKAKLAAKVTAPSGDTATTTTTFALKG